MQIEENLDQPQILDRLTTAMARMKETLRPLRAGSMERQTNQAFILGMEYAAEIAAGRAK